MKLLTTTALILALASPAFAFQLGGSNPSADASAKATAGASAIAGASVDNRNTNTNLNSNTNVASQHQGQAQGQIQGQSQANRQNNTQSVNIEDRNQAPGFGVGAAQGTAPCIKPQGLSLSVPLGGAGFSVSPVDQDCLNREAHYMMLEALSIPDPVVRQAAIASAASLNPHVYRVLVQTGHVAAPVTEARPVARAATPRPSGNCAQVPAAFRGDLNC